MKILFIGIFDGNEPNTAFRNAFRNASSKYDEIAHNTYRNKDSLQRDIVLKANMLSPDLIFLQLQGNGIISDETIDKLRKSNAFIVQWTGDARQPTPNHYFDVGSKINLSLFGNSNDINALSARGINADFLQISADHNIYSPLNISHTKEKFPEIVFMGNNYPNRFPLSSFRLKMCEFLKKTYGDRFGVYGLTWDKSICYKSLMYNQRKEAEVYRNCKIAINCSHYDLDRYTSDRFFRILLSGAFCLSKEFPCMEEYEPTINFDTFKNLSDLKNKIDYYLDNDAKRKEIALSGYNKAISEWKWIDRINELFKLLDKWKVIGQKI